MRLNVRVYFNGTTRQKVDTRVQINFCATVEEGDKCKGRVIDLIAILLKRLRVVVVAVAEFHDALVAQIIDVLLRYFVCSE